MKEVLLILEEILRNQKNEQMWHLIEENTMTVGVPFSRQFRKIITSDLYGIGENSDRKLTRQEIATMQVCLVIGQRS